MALKVLFFQFYMKLCFIYVKVPVLSLGSVIFCIMCVGTIAGQKSTEGYVSLHSITGITFHYFDSHMAAIFGIL